MSKIDKIIKTTKIHLRRYEYEEVEKCCDRILALCPESWWGLKYKGVSLYQRRKYGEAIPVYEKHLKLYPDDEDTKITLVEMYEKEERYKEALALSETIAHSDDSKSRQKRLMAKMGETPRIIREYDRQLHTVEIVEQTTDMIKRKIVLLEEKAVYLYRNGEYDKSHELFHETVQQYEKIKDEIQFHRDEFTKFYGMMKGCLEKCSKEEDFFEKFFKLGENSEAWFGRMENRLSNYEDPLVYTDILLEKNPENIELLENAGRISYSHDSDYSLD
ncbi:MAG: hypothetical protein BZ138_08265, partial [Methanosphaera sp. rholeuAM270]